jgi:hypothetical protein
LSVLFNGRNPHRAELLGVGPRIPHVEDQIVARVSLDDYGRPEEDTSGLTSVVPGETLPFKLAGLLKDRVYTFKAERLNVAEIGFGASSDLLPDARN